MRGTCEILVCQDPFGGTLDAGGAEDQRDERNTDRSGTRVSVREMMGV